MASPTREGASGGARRQQSSLLPRNLHVFMSNPRERLPAVPELTQSATTAGMMRLSNIDRVWLKADSRDDVKTVTRSCAGDTKMN